MRRAGWWPTGSHPRGPTVTLACQRVLAFSKLLNGPSIRNLGPRLPIQLVFVLPPYLAAPLTAEEHTCYPRLARTDRAVSPYLFTQRDNVTQNETEKTTSLTDRQLAALPHLAASSTLSQPARSAGSRGKRQVGHHPRPGLRVTTHPQPRVSVQGHHSHREIPSRRGGA